MASLGAYVSNRLPILVIFVGRITLRGERLYVASQGIFRCESLSLVTLREDCAIE